MSHTDVIFIFFHKWWSVTQTLKSSSSNCQSFSLSFSLDGVTGMSVSRLLPTKCCWLLWELVFADNRNAETTGFDNFRFSALLYALFLILSECNDAPDFARVFCCFLLCLFASRSNSAIFFGCSCSLDSFEWLQWRSLCHCDTPPTRSWHDQKHPYRSN